MGKKNLFSLAAALLSVGSVGCMGGSQPPYAGGGMASTPNHYAGQTAHQAGPSAVGPTIGQNAPQQRTPFGVVADAVTNNPAVAGVGQAWSNVAQSAARPVPSVGQDVLSLANQQRTPTPSLYTSMGKLAERSGDIAQARVHYQKALEVSPTDADALLAFGHLEDRQGRLGEALKLYDQAVRVNPKNATAHNDLGLCLARKGDHPAAAASLTNAIGLQPQRNLYRNNLAAVLIELGRNEEALAQLSTVNPPAVAHYNMGVLLHKGSDVARATEHFAVAARLDPSMGSANAWLAKLRGQVASPVVAQKETPENAPIVMPSATQPLPPTSGNPALQAAPNRPVAAPQTLVSANGQYGPSSPSKPQTDYPSVYSPQPADHTYPSLPPTPPVPQYVPDYPTFPQQASPMRYPAPSTSAQSKTGDTVGQSSWPLHQPSQVPSGPLVRAGAEPPVPTTVTNVYSNPRPQPLPPVQQASAATGAAIW